MSLLSSPAARLRRGVRPVIGSATLSVWSYAYSRAITIAQVSQRSTVSHVAHCGGG